MDEQRRAIPALAGRRVVVVGSSSGIGRGVAERAIASGAHVVVAARRVDRLKELVVEAGGGHLAELDLRVDESCHSFVENVPRRSAAWIYSSSLPVWLGSRAFDKQEKTIGCGRWTPTS